MKEHEASSQEAKRATLEELSKPLVAYLRDNYHPHCSIIVTDTFVRLVEDIEGIPFAQE